MRAALVLSSPGMEWACKQRIRMRRLWQSPSGKIYIGLGLIMTLLFITKVIEFAARSHVFNLEESEMEEYYAAMDQEDRRLIAYVRKNFLQPPVPVPYNLEYPLGHPEKKQTHGLLVQHFLKNKMNGIYFEAGANEGERYSHTLMLEKNFGWTGLLVEPDSRAFDKLVRKHRKAWVSDACVALEKRIHNVTFIEYKESTASKIFQMGYRWDSEGLINSGVKKYCVPLFTMVAALNMTVIDFLSLDTGGADFYILQTIPFDKLDIKIISVEHNPQHFPHSDSIELRRFMHKNNFYAANEILPRIILDYFFVHKSLLDAEQLEIVESIISVPTN